jgi:hypothetical protein
MKKAVSVLMIVLMVVAFAGLAMAAEMSGTVKSVDAAKGMLMLSSGNMDVPVDCETGSMIKDVKVGDKVMVEYTEKGGKKVATKVTVEQAKPKAAVGC